IGTYCEQRALIVLAAGKRVSLPDHRVDGLEFKIDDCQKIFDLPHGFFAVTAASPDSHRVVIELSLRLSKLSGREITLDVVEQIVEESRIRIEKARIMPRLEVIFAGRTDSQLRLCVFRESEPTDFNLSPGHVEIGSGTTEAEKFMWTKRQQTEKMSLQRTVFHMHKTLLYVRKIEKYVGPPADYLVMNLTSAFEIPSECALLGEWLTKFEKDSARRARIQN
ncbi:MAG TPA: hypothetical protein VMU26_27650, partial [Candidatus Polarisedimenticolia bacterium]|nr:hypothetical protein [Candidatus Polarisedimenticolia bacterium]